MSTLSSLGIVTDLSMWWSRSTALHRVAAIATSKHTVSKRVLWGIHLRIDPFQTIPDAGA